MAPFICLVNMCVEMKTKGYSCYLPKFTYHAYGLIINQAHIRTNELHLSLQVQGISDKFPKSNIPLMKTISFTLYSGFCLSLQGSKATLMQFQQ